MDDFEYEVRVSLKDVAEGDATDLAQRIFDEHGADLDAARGDFEVVVFKRFGSGVAALEWEPREA